MERITVKSENGYELSEGVSLEKVIEKLAAFENMYEALLTEIDKTVLSADRLKNMQKTLVFPGLFNFIKKTAVG